MNNINWNANRIYKILVVKQANKINIKEEVYNRVKEEINRRMNIIIRT